MRTVEYSTGGSLRHFSTHFVTFSAENLPNFSFFTGFKIDRDILVNTFLLQIHWYLSTHLIIPSVENLPNCGLSHHSILEETYHILVPTRSLLGESIKLWFTSRYIRLNYINCFKRKIKSGVSELTQINIKLIRYSMLFAKVVIVIVFKHI